MQLLERGAILECSELKTEDRPQKPVSSQFE